MEPRDFEVENVWTNEGQYKKLLFYFKGQSNEIFGC